MLGDQIKKVRTSYKLSQYEFSKMLNISKQSVSNWENNNIVPTVDMLKTIALKFSVSSDYLLELDDRFIVDVTGLPMETVAHIQLNKLPRCKHSCDSQASTMNCRAGY